MASAPSVSTVAEFDGSLVATAVRAGAPYKVVLLSRTLHLGGSERQLAEVARSLDRRWFEPIVVSFDGRGIPGDQLRAGGVPVVECPVRSFLAPRTPVLAWRFARWLRKSGAALVHPFDPPTAIFSVPIARAVGVPVVLSSQRGDRRLYPRATRTLLSLTDRMVDSIVVNSDYVRGVLTREFGLRAARLRLCRNGLDTSVFSPDGPSRRSELPGDGHVVGVVAALRPEKSIETLLDAFAQLPRTTHHLVIVGDGPCKPALQSRADRLGLGARCRFVPATSDVAAWYRTMDVFVLPSLNESFSNSLMEAMACGCAVVASRVGGNVELIRDGVNGLLFEPGDAGELARCLDVTLEDAEGRRRLAREGVRTIAADYTNEASAARFAALYRDAIERKLAVTGRVAERRRAD